MGTKKGISEKLLTPCTQMWGVKAIPIPSLTIIEAASPGDTRTGGGPEVELQTIVREDFTITEEKACTTTYRQKTTKMK